MRSLTRSAVQVGEVENVGGTAHWAAGAAETSLAFLNEGSGHGSGGEGEDGGEEHVDGW